MSLIVDYLYYIVLFASVVLGSYSIKKDNKIIFGIIAVMMILLALFRFGQGIDYLSYEFMYENQDVSSFGSMLNSQTRYEVGFRFLIFIFRNLGVSAHVFIAICSVFIIVMFSLWIFENSDNKTFSLVMFMGMFYLIWTLSALRQGVAMSIGTYFLFSKKRKLSIKQEILLVLGISLIHYSSIIYLLFILVREMKIKDEYLIGAVILSIVITFVPIPTLMASLSFIPGVTKLLDGAVSAPGIFDFSSLIRIGFSLYLFFLLWKYDWEKYERQIIQLVLSGTVLYFLLKMNELWAGRLAIYTFILMPIVFSMHLNKIRNFSLAKIGYVIACFAFSIVYFQKDASSTQQLTTYVNQTRFLKYKSVIGITYEDYFPFVNEVNLKNYFIGKTKEAHDTFFETFDTKSVPYDENNSMIIVKDNIEGNYRILNEHGQFVSNKSFSRKPTLRNRVAQVYPKGDYNPFEYEDIFDLDFTEEEMIKEVNESIIRSQEFSYTKPKVEVISKESLEDEILKVLPSIDPISKVTKLELSFPFKYHIVELDYFNFKFFLLFDENMKLMRDNVYTKYSRFNSDGIFTGVSMYGTEVVNKKGEVIWYEK